jgi:pilus assembly protein CpaB
MAINPSRLRLSLAIAILVALAILAIPKGRGSFHWSASDPGEVSPVLVADRYIPAFTVLKPSMIRVLDFPKGLVPPGALHAKAELQNENDQWLFTSALSIPGGHPLTRALLTDAGQSDALGSLIRPGKVAVSFEVDKAHGVGGWIRPGDIVALFGPAPMDVSGRHAVAKRTRLLLPSVLVLAVDAQRVGQSRAKTSEGGGEAGGLAEAVSANESKVVTVLASPTEAALIVEAREEGSLSVVLRSVGDDLPWPQVH